jgi:hypothetical protein
MKKCARNNVGYKIAETVIVPTGKCNNEALPGIMFCYEHTDKETIAYALKMLFQKFKKANPTEAEKWIS